MSNKGNQCIFSGEFARNLPDYQKIEILMFVMGKMPMPKDENALKSVVYNDVVWISQNRAVDMCCRDREVALQTKLMKTLLRVATKYETVLLSNAFPSSLLDPLLRMSMASAFVIRRIVQDILHTLIDRHGNKPRLRLLRSDSFSLIHRLSRVFKRRLCQLLKLFFHWKILILFAVDLREIQRHSLHFRKSIFT